MEGFLIYEIFINASQLQVKMNARDELSDLLHKDNVRDKIDRQAADILHDVCEKHKLKGQPLWRKAVHVFRLDQQWYGASIFSPWLETAGLIRMPNIPEYRRSVQSYIPTEKGLELYERLRSEGYFNHR